MSLQLFAGLRVRDFHAALAWYGRLFGEPTFFPHATEAVWTLAGDRSVYIEEHADGPGNSEVTMLVDDLDAHVADIAARGLEPHERVTYSNGTRKAIYLDADGNEVGFGGLPVDTPGAGISVKEATSEETPYGREITSDGWFVLNLADALALRNDAKGGAVYPLEPQESPFGGFGGVRIRVLWPGQPNALYHAEGEQEGFLVLAGTCTLIVEEEERPLRQWDYFHCPPHTHHVIVGSGAGPSAILMVGVRPDAETLHYPVSDVAAKHGASAAKETHDGDEAYADWPGEYLPVRLPWPVASDT